MEAVESVLGALGDFFSLGSSRFYINYFSNSKKSHGL